MRKHNLIFSIITSFCLITLVMFILTACREYKHSYTIIQIGDKII